MHSHLQDIVAVDPQTYLRRRYAAPPPTASASMTRPQSAQQSLAALHPDLQPSQRRSEVSLFLSFGRPEGLLIHNAPESDHLDMNRENVPRENKLSSSCPTVPGQEHSVLRVPMTELSGELICPIPKKYRCNPPNTAVTTPSRSTSIVSKRPLQPRQPARLCIRSGVRGTSFREVQGHRDDELVPKTEAHIHLTEWEHFYSAQAKLNPGSVA